MMSIEALPAEGPGDPPRRFGSRVRAWLAASAALVLLYALFGFFVVPRIIRSQIQSRSLADLHREARIDDVRFNPFTLTATIGGLRVLDRDQADLVRLEKLMVNFEVSGVFRRAWRFSEIRKAQDED